MSKFDKHEITFSKVKKQVSVSQKQWTTVSVSLVDLELLPDAEVNGMSPERELLIHLRYADFFNYDLDITNNFQSSIFKH